jgi:trans-L-3-hydroxyproline dehydratase
MAAMNPVRRFRTLDYHTAGEPLRIVLEGLPALPGDNMLARRRYMQAHHDDARRLLMLEPRGHADMYGAVITDPVNEDSDCGVLFLHNEGYSTMCGHGIIGLATAVIEHDLLPLREAGRVRIDTPAGPVDARVNTGQHGVESVSFLNVPAFVQESFAMAFEGRAIQVTLAFGGAYYVYVDADELNLALEPGNATRLIATGRAIKSEVTAKYPVRHPGGDEDLDFLYGVIFVQHKEQPGHSRNVCIFADGELDRSPTGTGVSGRAAIHFANGDIGLDELLTIDSIIGTAFTVSCVKETRVAGQAAVITQVTGSAHMTGEHQFVLDPRDPLPNGIFIR